MIAVNIPDLQANLFDPLGVLVYKNDPQSEYDLNHLLEIKSLFLFNPSKNSGKGIATNLLKYAENIVNTDVLFEKIFVTVTEDKIESINFFKKHDFIVYKQIKDKYIDNKSELLFYKDIIRYEN